METNFLSENNHICSIGTCRIDLKLAWIRLFVVITGVLRSKNLEDYADHRPEAEEDKDRSRSWGRRFPFIDFSFSSLSKANSLSFPAEHVSTASSTEHRA